MTKNREILEKFFSTIEEMKNAGIIRSDRYLGDIGEFLASEKYNVELSKNQREEIIDGEIGKETVQIKFNGSPTGKNINIGRADKYDVLIIVLYKNSLHFPKDCEADFVFYKMKTKVHLGKFTQLADGNYTCTQKKLQGMTFERLSFFDGK